MMELIQNLALSAGFNVEICGYGEYAITPEGFDIDVSNELSEFSKLFLCEVLRSLPPENHFERSYLVWYFKENFGISI